MALQLARLRGGFGGSERGGRDMLGDPQGYAVAAVPCEDVAVSEDDVFEGVGWKAVLAYDFHSVVNGGLRHLRARCRGAD